VSEQWGRSAAFRELVAGLLDARNDYATTEFDRALAAAEADETIDPAAARLLRWWQRETLRALVEHATRVLPATVLALEQADAAAVAEVAEARASYQAAVGPEAAADEGAEPTVITVVLPDIVVLPDTAALLDTGVDTAAVGTTGVGTTGVGMTAVETAGVGRVELRPWPGPPAPPDDASPPLPGLPGPAHGPTRRTLVAGLRILPRPDDPARTR